MRNGNIIDFIDKLYLGEELLFEYAGCEYFVQGWTENGKSIMVLDCSKQTPFEDYVWKTERLSMRECAEEFLEATIWNNKSFNIIQKDVIWKD